MTESEDLLLEMWFSYANRTESGYDSRMPGRFLVDGSPRHDGVLQAVETYLQQNNLIDSNGNPIKQSEVSK